MKRKAHKLKKIKGTEKKENWLYFDTETRSIKKTDKLDRQSLYLGVAQHYRYDKTKHLQSECIFRDTETIADYIESCTRRNSILNCMSMNLAFDFTICRLAEHLKANGWKLKTMMIESKVVILKYRKDKKSIVFVDLFNYVKASIKQIGELINLPKLDVDFGDVSDKDLIIYCRRDTEIIAVMMRHYMDFIIQNDLGCLGLTTPAQAFNAYRHRFMDTDIFIHDFDDASKLERSSYYGGRTECFFVGLRKSKTYALDINSMYPDVMRKYKYPTKLIYSCHYEAELEDVVGYVKDHIVIADCLLDTNEPAYCIKRDEKTIFPTGQFRATLAQASLIYALEKGHIKDVLAYTVYECEYIFREYIDFFYDLRLKHKRDGNIVFDQMDKLFLNSLYGKFGQRTKEMKVDGMWFKNDTGIIEVYGTDGVKIADRVTLAGESFLIFTKQEESFNAFVAIASCVTDYARMDLWKLINKAGRKNVYYCDTDSLFLNKKGMDNLKDDIDTKILGKLKLENTFKWLRVNGLKDYDSDCKTTLKGIKKNAEKLSNDKYRQLQFPTFRGVIRSGMDGYIDIKTIEKTLTRNYTKGKVHKSGRVTPFKLTEGT